MKETVPVWQTDNRERHFKCYRSAEGTDGGPAGQGIYLDDNTNV